MLSTFTRAGAPPDLAPLIVTLTPLIDGPFTVVAIIRGDGVLHIEIDKPTDWTGPQVTAVQAAVTAAAALSPQSAQQRDVDGMPIVLKALALALIDQLNVIRAALPVPLGAITPTQAIAAIRVKAGTL